jgi:hypothetical protein
MQPERIWEQFWYLFIIIFIIVVSVGIGLIFSGKYESDIRTGLYLALCGGIVLVALIIQKPRGK